jgi:heat shock protein HslJ
VDGDDVTISALSATRMACASIELQAQESDYLAGLSVSNARAEEGTDLELADASGRAARRWSRSAPQ